MEDINECDNQIMGDSNNDGSVNVLDIINIVNFIPLFFKKTILNYY